MGTSQSRTTEVAVFQPLTSSCHDLSEADLTSQVHVSAPTVRKVHAALDGCASESGPLRFESALVAGLANSQGQVFLLQNAPSPALQALLDAAPGARASFDAHLGLPTLGEAPFGKIKVTGGAVEPAPGAASMSVLLAMLERDPQTTPSSLERLFLELTAAQEAGLVEMSESKICLTAEGRKMISDAQEPLRATSEQAIEAIDLYAQEVADGRLTLKEALDAVGKDLGLSLPDPGQDIAEDADVQLAAGVRTGTTALQEVFKAARDIPEDLRLDVVVAGMVSALGKLGVEEESAAERVRNDLRLLRLFGGSLSHGLPDLKRARARLLPEHAAMISLFERRLPEASVALFLLERPAAESPVEDSDLPQNGGWFARFLRGLGFKV